MGKSSKKSSVAAAPAAVSVPEGKSVKKGKAFDSSIVALESLLVMFLSSCFVCTTLITVSQEFF